MISSKRGAVIRMMILAVMFLASNNMDAEASAFTKNESYVLLYDRLYDYASNSSDVLRQYIELKAYGADVVLLRAERSDVEITDKKTRIISFPSSFESAEKYQQALQTFKGYKVTPFNGKSILPAKKGKNKGLFLAVSEVYPFSDLNKLMDLAERLHSKGIGFIVSIMPVYDNYQFEAFQKFVDVLKYVGKKGGRIFIHFPVVNYEGTYNLDPTALFEKALQEYRNRGLEILGITLPQNKMLNDLRVYDGLGLPFILVTEADGKISADLDLFKVSRALNDFIVIKGTYIDNFDFFGYRGKNFYDGEQAVMVTAQGKEDRLFHLLSVLEDERVSVWQFRVSDYRQRLRNLGFDKHVGIFEEQEKSQHEKFLEEEMRKIRGENLEGEKFVQGYDISTFSAVVVKMAVFLLGIFSVMVMISRRFNLRKFFKDQ